MDIKDIESYKLAREISKDAWDIYSRLNFNKQKIIGDQFIRSVDSIAANIAEGHGRYHYLDRNKFNYNARGSLIEAKHWLELLLERKIINEKQYAPLHEKLVLCAQSINRFIQMTREAAKEL